MKQLVKSWPRERWALLSFKNPTKTKHYYISNHGRLKSVDKTTEDEKLVKTSPDHRGFYRASIKLKQGYAAVFVHKEVAIAFVKQASVLHECVIHKNLMRNNNHHTNIKWVKEADWKLYVKARAEKFGFEKSKKGGYFKLTEGEVAIIKKMLQSGKTRKKMIAKRFGVSSTQVKRIERGENWSHIEPAK